MRNLSCGVGAAVIINRTPLCSDVDILPSLTPLLSLQVSNRSCCFRPPRLFCPVSVFFIHLYLAISFFLFSPSLFQATINRSLIAVLSLLQGHSNRQLRHVLLWFLHFFERVTSNLKLKLFSIITTFN